VDATTKFQWEAIKTLATKAQKVEDKGKGKGKAPKVEDTDKGKANVIEVEDDNWGDDELRQNCIWVYWRDCSTSRAKLPGATPEAVAACALARLCIESRQDAWCDS
jgi:hypothetical protein